MLYLTFVGCPDNFYGQNCSQRCHCANDLSCHPVHGACQCQNGTNECENGMTKPTYSSRYIEKLY